LPTCCVDPGPLRPGPLPLLAAGHPWTAGVCYSHSSGRIQPTPTARIGPKPCRKAARSQPRLPEPRERGWRLMKLGEQGGPSAYRGKISVTENPPL